MHSATHRSSRAALKQISSRWAWCGSAPGWPEAGESHGRGTGAPSTRIVRNRWLPHGGLVRNNDGRHRWTLFTRHFGDPAPSRCIEIIRGCAGDPALAAEILATGVWQKAALLADRFVTAASFWPGTRRGA